MEQKIIKKAKKLLLKEKKQVEKMLGRFTEKNTEVKGDFKTKFPNFGSSREENVKEVATFSNNLSMECNLEKFLKDIKEALKRIEQGTYGVCQHCKEAISKERLLARPASSICIKCKKKIKDK